MLANFLIFAIILGISESDHRAPESASPSRAGATRRHRAGSVRAGAGRHAPLTSRYFTIRNTWRTTPRSSSRMASSAAQHNPRLNSLAREIPRGDIYDRNGVLLATSSWSELEQRRAEYEKLGVAIDSAAPRSTTAIIRSARRRRICSAICAPARNFTRRTRL